MPSRADIQNEVFRLRNQSQDLVRRAYLKKLNEKTGRDTLIYASSFTSAKIQNIPPYLLSITTEDIQGFMAALHGLKGKQLDLILHSPGGSLEAAEQIVQYLRAKYDHVRALIPQNAMSAATMIACACDEIVMGKQSALGPIDPQITFPTQTGQRTAAAQDLLKEFEQAKLEVESNPKLAPIWVTKIKDYPPGILNLCKRTTDLAIEKVAAWLKAYMFKGQADGEAKAEKIARWLGNAEEHKTHGRPVGLAVATDLGLNVVPMEQDDELQDLILSVFHSTAVTFDITPCIKFVENHNARGWFLSPATS